MSETGAIAKALSQLQGEIQNPSNTATNPFLKNKYAPLDEILNGVRPLLSKHGLSVVQMPISTDGHIGVQTVLMHESGEQLLGEIMLPLGEEKGKSLAQVAGSIITYLRRYAITAYLGIAGEDDDDGNRAPAKQEVKQKPERTMDAGRMQSLKAMHDKIMAWADERKTGMSRDQYAYIKGMREKAIDHYLQTGDEPTTWLSGGFAKIEARWIEAHPEDPSAPRDPDVPVDHEPDDADLAAEAEQELF